MNSHTRSGSTEELLRQTAWLRALAVTLVGDASDADDLAQETWLHALRRPFLQGGDERSQRSWLAAIARNLAASTWRSRARRSARELAAARGEAAVADSLERVQLQRELVDAVMALDAAEREVVILRYFDELPPREIARRLGLSNDAVRSRLKRALERLRARLDRRFEGRAAWVALSELLRTRSAGPAAYAASAGKPLLAALSAALLLCLGGLGSYLALRSPQGPAVEGAPTLLAGEQRSIDEPPPSELLASERQATPSPAAPARPTEVASTQPENVALLARFVDAQRIALAGVTLELADASPPLSAQSDSRGEVRLVLPWPYSGRTVGGGQVELRAHGPALATRRWHAPLPGPGERSLGEIVLVPGGDVRGRVVDDQRRPVAGAWVSAVAPLQSPAPQELEFARAFGTSFGGLGDGLGHGTRSGVDGEFVLAAQPAVRVCVIARASATLTTISAPLEVRVAAEVDAGELVLELPDDAQRIAGWVRDESGAPLTGIAVELETSRQRFALARASTDAAGRFQLIVARGGSYDLAVSRERGSAARLVVRQVAAGTLDLDVTLPSAREVEVAVLSNEGDALREPRVFLTSESGHGLPVEMASAGPGLRRFTSPPGSFHVHAYVEGFRPAEQGPFDPASVPARLEFVLARANGLRGRVTARGAPVAGASVHAHQVLEEGCQVSDDGFHSGVDAQASQAIATDGEGRFFLPLLESSSWILHAEHAGYARAASAPLNYRDGVDLECADLELVEGGALEGRVLVADGVEALGTLVGIGSGDGHVQALEVAADGRFRFEHLAPGAWQVRRCDPELFERTASGVFLNSRDCEALVWDVDVLDGAASRFDLDLRQRVPSHLQGALELGGTALDGWRATLSAGSSLVRGQLDTGGRFRVDTPAPGEFELSLWGPSSASVRVWISQRVKLAPGANAWTLKLDTGRVRLAGLPRFAANEQRESAPYALRWSRPDGVAWRASILASNGEPVVLPLVPAGRVELVEAAGERVVLAFEVTRDSETLATLP